MRQIDIQRQRKRLAQIAFMKKIGNRRVGILVEVVFIFTRTHKDARCLEQSFNLGANLQIRKFFIFQQIKTEMPAFHVAEIDTLLHVVLALIFRTDLRMMLPNISGKVAILSQLNQPTVIK